MFDCFELFCFVLLVFVWFCLRLFLFVGLCLLVCSFVCLSVCLSICLFVCLVVCLFFFLSLFVCLSVCCSLTPSHANEAMEFRPKENVDAHSCTCFVETVDQAVLLRCFPALPFDLTFMVFQIDLNI